MTDLRDELLAPPTDTVEVEVESNTFKITDDGLAVWAARKLKEAEAECGRIHMSGDAEVDRIHRWQDNALKQPMRDIEFFLGALIDYRIRLQEQEPGRPNTYRIPGAKLFRRKLPDQIVITDDAALIEWAKGDERLVDVVRTSERALVSELKKVVEIKGDRIMGPEGDVVPGVIWDVRGDVYDVKLEADEDEL